MHRLDVPPVFLVAVFVFLVGRGDRIIGAHERNIEALFREHEHEGVLNGAGLAEGDAGKLRIGVMLDCAPIPTEIV